MNPNDVDHAIQMAGERHLVACMDHEHACDFSDNPADWPPSPASAPFCGCEKCVTREVLTGAWPAIEEHVIAPLKHDNRAMFWRGFIAGCAYAIVMTFIGFGLGFMAGWVA